MVPYNISEDLVKEVKDSLSELPEEKQKRLIDTYNLNEYDAAVLCADKSVANFFEKVAQNADALLTAKWIIGDLNALLNKNDIALSESKITTANFSVLIQKISDNTISGKIAKEVLEAIWDSGEDVAKIIEGKGLQQISNESELEAIVDQIINDNPSQVAAYKSGKEKLFGFFVGQAMKATQGKANPGLFNKI